MGFPRQEYWSELPFPPPRSLSNQGSNLCLLHWQVDSLPLSHLGSQIKNIHLENTEFSKASKKTNSPIFNWGKDLSTHCTKENTWNAGDTGFIPELERSPGEGNGNSLQYSCLGNPMDRGAWWAAVHGVAKSQKQLMY